MTENILTEENTKNAFESAQEIQSTSKDTRENIPEKTFTQSQLEAMISERLKRERKNTEALRQVKDLLSNLCNSGAIKSSSYSEMAKELESKLSERELREDIVKAQSVGEVDEVFTNMTGNEEDSTDNLMISQEENVNVKDEQEQTKGENDTPKPVLLLTSDEARRIKEAYPECDIGSLLCDNSFEAFSKGRSGTIFDIYGDYLTFLTVLDNKSETIERRMFADTASTSF